MATSTYKDRPSVTPGAGPISVPVGDPVRDAYLVREPSPAPFSNREPGSTAWSKTQQGNTKSREEDIRVHIGQ